MRIGKSFLRIVTLGTIVQLLSLCVRMVLPVLDEITIKYEKRNNKSALIVGPARSANYLEVIVDDHL